MFQFYRPSTPIHNRRLPVYALSSMLDPAHLRIATWNVEKVAPGRSQRSQVVATALQSVDADIVILTESHHDFAPSASHTLAAASTTAPDRVGGQRWVCIWIRTGWASTAIPLQGEPERSAAVRILLPTGGALLVFGTVLPWRSDTRVPTFRGARAFVRSLEAQSDDVTRIRQSHPDDLLCFAGDWNQELAVRPQVGTAAGKKHLELFLSRHDLLALTAGDRDPLSARGWRSSIDHIAVSRSAGARATVPVIWPEAFPLPKGWPDHHGVALGLTAEAPSRPKKAPATKETVRERIAWSYANLARAHAALFEGAAKYTVTHHMIRARMFKGLKTGTLQIGTLFDDEVTKLKYAKACCYCGGSERLSLDHLIPRISGGSESADNLVWDCRSCKSYKGDRDLLFWMASQSRFPPLLVLRRYTKLMARFCDQEGLLDLPLADALSRDLPFRLDLLPLDFRSLGTLTLWVEPADPACR